jgi:DNA-binding transcriptional ArsR family regulator
MSWLLSPYVEQRTYRVFLYLLLGLPLGILDFTIMVTGLSLGLGLIITLVGIPVLVATLIVARSLAALERGLALSLLDAPMPRRRPERDGTGGYFWARLRNLVFSRRTWSEVGFLFLRLPLGILDFTVAVTIIALALSGLVMPIVVASGVQTTIGSWQIDTFLEALVYLPVSVIFLLVGPRLMLAWSTLSRWLATSLLGRVEPYELKQAVSEVLARMGEADGFQILDELELRLGRGPFLTPTTLEATLLALESTGYVSVRRNDNRNLYALAHGSQLETASNI